MCSQKPYMICRRTGNFIFNIIYITKKIEFISLIIIEKQKRSVTPRSNFNSLLSVIHTEENSV